MKIIIKVGGRWRNCIKTHILFNRYEEHIYKKMAKLSKALKFKQPKHLLLRPFYFKYGYSLVNGRACYDPITGYAILMSVPQCSSMPDKGIKVLDEEISHVVSAIKHDNWSHDRQFKAIFKLCRTI